MILLPVIESRDVFYSQASGIDWDVIFLMLGMMIIVSVMRQTGAFEYAAIWAVKRANGSPLRIMILFTLVMALASAVLPNVVSVLLIAPVTLLVCERLEINPVPLLMPKSSRLISAVPQRWSAIRPISSSAPVKGCRSTHSSEHGADRAHRHAGLRRRFAHVLPGLLRSLPERVADVIPWTSVNC